MYKFPSQKIIALKLAPKHPTCFNRWVAKVKYQVIVKTSMRDRPKDHEMSAAILLADYFRSDIIFLRPEQQKTPDLSIGGIHWEVKSPIGDGKKTMDNNLHTARKQSKNIIIDLRRCKMNQMQAIWRIRHFLASPHCRIKHLKILTKTKKIVDII